MGQGGVRVRLMPRGIRGGARCHHCSPSRQRQAVIRGGPLSAPDPGNKFIRCRGYNLLGVICPPRVEAVGLRVEVIDFPASSLGPAFSSCPGPCPLACKP